MSTLKGDSFVKRLVFLADLASLGVVEDFKDPFERDDAKRCISIAFRELGRREAEVLRLYYGLHEDYEGNYISLTYEEIGERFNLTRARIMQIRIKAINKLKSPHVREILKQILETQ